MQKAIKGDVNVQEQALQVLRDGTQKGGQVYIAQKDDTLAPHLQDPLNGEATLFVDRHRVNGANPKNKYRVREVQELAGETIRSAKSGLSNATLNYNRPAITAREAAELYIENQHSYNKDGMRIETIVRITGKTPKKAIEALGNAVKDIDGDRVVISSEELTRVKNFKAVHEALVYDRSI